MGAVLIGVCAGLEGSHEGAVANSRLILPTETQPSRSPSLPKKPHTQ